MGDALLHAEVVVFGTAPPCLQLRVAEERADAEEEDGPLTAAAGWGCKGGFCFCWALLVRGFEGRFDAELTEGVEGLQSCWSLLFAKGVSI